MDTVTEVHFPAALFRVNLPDFDFASDFSLVTTLEKKNYLNGAFV